VLSEESVILLLELTSLQSKDAIRVPDEVVDALARDSECSMIAD